MLENDHQALAASGEKGMAELGMATHAGMTTEEFAAIAGDWNAKAWHPKLGRPYTDLVYQPMIELLAKRDLVSGARTDWDVLPGAQVTINKRQHVRLAAGVRLPVTDADVRTKSVIVYLLWDWYEGGFLQGW